MILLTMINGEQHRVSHGTIANERRWCVAYLQDADIIGADLIEEGENEMTEYTAAEVVRMEVTKCELFRPVPRGFDFALPQPWLDAFNRYCKEHRPEITYPLIQSTTCWDCNENRPAFKVREVREAYEKYKENN